MLRPVSNSLALVGLLAVAGCGMVPGSGVNIVPWPGTEVSHSAQPVRVAAARPVTRHRVVFAHSRHTPQPATAGRAEAESPSPQATAALAPAATQAHGPAIDSSDPHAQGLKRLLDWHSQRSAKQAQEEQENRELSKSINSICRGC